MINQFANAVADFAVMGSGQGNKSMFTSSLKIDEAHISNVDWFERKTTAAAMTIPYGIL